MYILVGLDDPGEGRAKLALINEIMRDLATGLDQDRYQSVQDLVQRLAAGELRMVDARATDHHAKLYIVDRSHVLVGSPNTTYKGFVTQHESGTIQDDPNEALYFADAFDTYFAEAKDITQELLNALQRWLTLETPWHIYLKNTIGTRELDPPEKRV